MSAKSRRSKSSKEKDKAASSTDGTTQDLETYEVLRVVDEKIVDGVTYFLLKWKDTEKDNWSLDKYDQWTSQENVECWDLVEKFKLRREKEREKREKSESTIPTRDSTPRTEKKVKKKKEQEPPSPIKKTRRVSAGRNTSVDSDGEEEFHFIRSTGRPRRKIIETSDEDDQKTPTESRRRTRIRRGSEGASSDQPSTSRLPPPPPAEKGKKKKDDSMNPLLPLRPIKLECEGGKEAQSSITNEKQLRKMKLTQKEKDEKKAADDLYRRTHKKGAPLGKIHVDCPTHTSMDVPDANLEYSPSSHSKSDEPAAPLFAAVKREATEVHPDEVVDHSTTIDSSRVRVKVEDTEEKKADGDDGMEEDETAERSDDGEKDDGDAEKRDEEEERMEEEDNRTEGDGEKKPDEDEEEREPAEAATPFIKPIVNEREGTTTYQLRRDHGYLSGAKGRITKIMRRKGENGEEYTFARVVFAHLSGERQIQWIRDTVVKEYDIQGLLDFYYSKISAKMEDVQISAAFDATS